MFDVLAHAALGQFNDSRVEGLGMGGQPSLQSVSMEVRPLCAQLQTEYWKALAVVAICVGKNGSDGDVETLANEIMQRVIDGERVPNRVEVERMFARAREQLEKSVENTSWQKPSFGQNMSQ